MQVEAGDFINRLRERFALKLQGDTSGTMAAFDRACVQVLVDEHKQPEPVLTKGQKSAITKARNKAERLRQANGATAPMEASHGQQE